MSDRSVRERTGCHQPELVLAAHHTGALIGSPADVPEGAFGGRHQEHLVRLLEGRERGLERTTHVSTRVVVVLRRKIRSGRIRSPNHLRFSEVRPTAGPRGVMAPMNEASRWRRDGKNSAQVTS